MKRWQQAVWRAITVAQIIHFPAIQDRFSRVVAIALALIGAAVGWWPASPATERGDR